MLLGTNYKVKGILMKIMFDCYAQVKSSIESTNYESWKNYISTVEFAF